MGMRIPTESPGQTRVPGEGVFYALGRFALVVAGLTVVAGLLVVYGWSMGLLATHTGGGITGALERLLLVLMGALGVAALATGAWSVLQHPAVRRRHR